MNEQGYTGVIRRFFRSVILIDATLAVIMGLISFLLGPSTFEAFGALLISAGIGLILIAIFVGVGGVASRREDIAAFELSGAGDMALKTSSESLRLVRALLAVSFFFWLPGLRC